MYFDFHTHKSSSNPSVFNIRLGHEQNASPANPFYSVGIHPWDVDNIDVEAQLILLRQELEKKKIIALGEIGLDKVFGTNLVLQQHVFDKQIEIANEYHRKVLIIHCVKSYEEILKARQKAGKNQIWVLHGFNGGEALIKQLVKANFYFSIGATLFNPKSRLVKNLQFIPPERLFLETDDSNLSIKQVFDQFALLRKMDSASIQQQIRSNLTDVFGDIAEVT